MAFVRERLRSPLGAAGTRAWGAVATGLAAGLNPISTATCNIAASAR